jgi:raffinose/stachyose/melibiose transport system substrate-binding protein
VPSFTDEQGNLKPQFDRFTLPSAGTSDAVPRTDFFAHSGLGTAIRKDADTPAMREWIKYLFSRLGEVAISEYGYLPSVKPQNTERLSELNQSFLDEIENLATIAKLWDVRLDPDSVDVLARESTNLGIGRASAEQFAERVQATLDNSHASQ